MADVPPQDPSYDPNAGAGYQQPPPPPPYGAPGAYGPPGAAGSAWSGPPLAEWPQRFLAGLIDWGIGVVVLIGVVIVAAIVGAVSGTLGALVLVLGYLAVLAYNYIALGYWNGAVGQTIGKKALGLKVVRMDDGQLLGGGAGIGRAFCHILDGICLIGFLFPLWDPLKQTFADKIMKTVVIQVPKQPFKL
ncbi:MAG TPA: RDD family protein, partial [Acidimicrobiales bacterium]